MSSNATIVFIPHGGGPLPLLNEPGHAAMNRFLRGLPTTIEKPGAIVVISAHWEESVIAITAAAAPQLARRLAARQICIRFCPVASCHASRRRIAPRAAAYGLPWRIADGNDVLDVFATVSEAVAHARSGGGTTVRVKFAADSNSLIAASPPIAVMS